MMAFLCREKTIFEFSGWKRLLRIAKEFDWEPLGTKKPYCKVGDEPEFDSPHSRHAEKWDGNYLSCEGQLVCREDAENFGKALRKAFKEGKIPFGRLWDDIWGGTKLSQRNRTPYLTDGDKAEAEKIPQSELNDFLDDKKKEYFVKFISFCCEDEFAITNQSPIGS